MCGKSKSEILELRKEFSKTYDCFSVKEDEEGSFNPSGCDCCQSLPCTTYETQHLKWEDVNKRKFDNVYESELCSGCLCSLINGDDSDLDY